MSVLDVERKIFLNSERFKSENSKNHNNPESNKNQSQKIERKLALRSFIIGIYQFALGNFHEMP